VKACTKESTVEAYLYEKLPDDEVHCLLCHHRCLIKPGRRGICQVRENRGGTLETLVYGQIIARNVDPIEKKPLFHLSPGSLSYSIATVGCNFRCRFCQNADIAQMPADRDGMIAGRPTTPEAVVADAVSRKCDSIAYTYTEPTVYFEFAYETAKLARAKGLHNVFVTNGYMSAQALEMIQPFLDAANVDLKAFTEDFYKTRCSARLAPVLDSLRLMKRLGIFVEITTLIIPGLNDDAAQIEALARFIADELDVRTPWHISRFHPTYRMTDRPPTAVESLQQARQIGLDAGLKYVYTGNVPGDDGEDTYCPGCGACQIDRWGFYIQANRLTGGKCSTCGTPVDGINMGG